jgi:protein-tyrosine phosphatase
VFPKFVVVSERLMNPSQSSPHRVFALRGGCNFRDIGGYRAQAATVRWGKVYRTGVLSYLTDEDHRALQQLRVTAICDLRRAEEREREPTSWPDSNVSLLHWGDGEVIPTIRAFAARHPATPAGMYAAMLDLYRALPAWMAPRLRGMFECIAADRTPLIVHCAAGKDRTGIAIALLLHVLGVSMETILEDYVLTNSAGDFEQFIRTRGASHLGLADQHHPLLALSPEVRRVLFAAEADYLQAAFTAIDSEFGGVDAYLANLVQVDTQILQRARAALLQ